MVTRTDLGSDNGKEHGFATGGNSNEHRQPPMIGFSSNHIYALGVQPAPVFQATPMRNSSGLGRLNSSEVLARLGQQQHTRSVR
jgi:hypothetical protein